jgi:hypothetical protein
MFEEQFISEIAPQDLTPNHLVVFESTDDYNVNKNKYNLEACIYGWCIIEVLTSGTGYLVVAGYKRPISNMYLKTHEKDLAVEVFLDGIKDPELQKYRISRIKYTQGQFEKDLEVLKTEDEPHVIDAGSATSIYH